ncbi:MAG TPA: hypothetical protein PKE03_01730 [Bacteroidales bacterium]|nr:hypothetical protein [Bacteroidales bacterium]
MEANHLMRYGGLLKYEPLSCVEHNLPIKDTCVLESVSPFYGYYDQIPDIRKPLYLYLMLEGHLFTSDIMLAVNSIRKKAGFPFDAVHASITFPGQDPVYCIRVRDLALYSDIEQLQEYFVEEGLKMKRRQKVIQNAFGWIRLDKHFFLEPWGDGMYKDLQQLHHGYFELPGPIAWDKFVELTTEVKYDTNLLYFDAARAFFFEKDKTVELIRIYRENMSKEHLMAIKARYLKLFDNHV